MHSFVVGDRVRLRAGLRAACAVAVFGLLAWMPNAARADVSLALASTKHTAVAGDTIVVDATIDQAGSAFNAFEIVVHFDPTLVTFVQASPLSKQIGPLMTNATPSQFHVFNAMADSLVADVSLLGSGVSVTGPGTVYRLTFVAKPASGVAQFKVGVSSAFYQAGIIIGPLTTRMLTIGIGSVTGVGVADGDGLELEAPRPNPARAGHGATVGFSLVAPARVALALFDLQGRTVAARDLGTMPAGRSSVRWAPSVPAGRYELVMRADGAAIGRRGWVVLR